MKILILGTRERYAKYIPALPFIRQQELIFLPWDSGEEEILRTGADAGILFVDAIGKVPGRLIERMPNLKLIHSEGVGYNGIDLETARARGIYVCNNRGCNAGAVAELSIMLMLMLLRGGIAGDLAVRQGRQMEVKERTMAEGGRELSACKVGLYGFGDIAKATAARLAPFGCETYYYSRTRKSQEEERRYHAIYLPREELIARCDIISLHTSVTDETKGLVDKQFLSRMKPTAYLINTARGDLVDNDALREAIVKGKIAGAGLDTLSPEPTPADHPLVSLPEECRDRVILSPHIGGITEDSFRRCHFHMWRNAERVVDGHMPDNIVNGL